MPGRFPRAAVLTVAFELDGQPFTALNGGPEFKFDEAISFEIDCADQEQADHYTEAADRRRRRAGAVRLGQGPLRRLVAGRPVRLRQLLSDSDPETAARVMSAMLKMRRIDVAALEEAFEGRTTASASR